MTSRLFAVLLLLFGSNVLAQERFHRSLDGTWQLQVEGSEAWKPVSVPGTFEEQIAIEFDGTAVYRKQVQPVDIESGRRLLLHFDAVATRATVWFNGMQVGQHLGGWTPFRLDVTEAARSRPEGPWVIQVLVDELVGHNTQGFLPVIAPHFGGIWQSVELIDVSENWIDERKLDVRLMPDGMHVEMGGGFRGHSMHLYVREFGSLQWHRFHELSTSLEDVGENFRAEIQHLKEPPNWKRWSPNDPVLYEIRLDVHDATGGVADSCIKRVGFRDFAVRGDGFVLNGKPVNLRGLLNWGYAPPRTAPHLDEDFMRSEIQFAKDRGFNLMKFCLWIPPRRYLELCDEMGMMAWIEYPAWHPDFSREHLDSLKEEYDEFFLFDRNFRCVVLRSLTCETGPSADIRVVQELYDQCKSRIAGAVVVDDSSWIAWNRVFDFYDDHPYGNNHTWVGELNRLKQFIATRATRPLMLGEAITADTWTDPQGFARENPGDDHWQPNFLESSRRWLTDARKRYGEDAINHLQVDSRNYAMLMRKYQMETFRREVPRGGYVVSVIRDMPKAAMGLIGFDGRPKWKQEDWSWHRDKMLLMETGNDRRSFFPDEKLAVKFTGAGFDGNRFDNYFLANVIGKSSGEFNHQLECVHRDHQERPESTVDEHVDYPATGDPFQCVVTAVSMSTNDEKSISSLNYWPVWIVPSPARKSRVVLHSSVTELVKNITRWEDAYEVIPVEHRVRRAPATVLTSQLDESILSWLSAGARVVLLANNQPGSFPLEAHWFLRGGPVISDRCAAIFDREMLVELQHFDLAGDVIRDITYLDSIDPLFMLWEAHDLDHIKTNGLLFHVPVGQRGSLFVSALKHDGMSNAAGSYVLKKLVDEINHGQLCDDLMDAKRGTENLKRLRTEISQRKLMLDDRLWKFRPDVEEQGRETSWFATEFDDSEWEEISIDRHWESQGNDQLDHWAWYRLQVMLPADWQGEKLFINFTGVDDYYDVYVNGTKVGNAGNIEERSTAFDLRTSHEITDQVQAGSPVQITVAVYDWYGAGGIFRPAWISTQPISDQPRMLK